MNFLDLDWPVIFGNFVHLLIAYILALPIGWEREASKRRMGLRTFPLVAVVSCGFMLTALSVLPDAEPRARVMQGIITGIGFIGGGAILKQGGTVAGTATAASIWNTGAIGMAVAWRRFEIALVLSFVNFLTLHLMSRIKKEFIKEDMDTTEEESR